MLYLGLIIWLINAPSKANIVVSAENAIYCLDYNGLLKWSFSHSYFSYTESDPVIGNLDNNGMPEIAVGADKLYYFNYTGAVKWSYNKPFWTSSPAMVNVDTTGDAEIVIADSSALYCFNVDGTVKWSYPVPDVYQYSWLGPTVTAANIDTNRIPEIFAVTPTKVYCVNGDGTLKWSCPLPGDYAAGIGMADIDMDGNVDIVINTNLYSGGDYYYLHCLQADGTIKWSYTGSGFISPPAIADINNDTVPEIVVHNSEITPKTIIAFQENTSHNGLNVIWTAVVEDVTPISTTSPVICDIDGDGDKDVLWVGCSGCSPTGGVLYILNGTDGKHPDNSGSPCYTNSNFASRTYFEHACSVADIDGDGCVEIVGISANGGDIYGVAAIECDSCWATGRNMFSSHNYHITEINDNLYIPDVEPENWKNHNTWLTQLTTGGTGFGTPSLKWSYSNSALGWIPSSIAIAPLDDSAGVEEKTNPKNLIYNLQFSRNPFRYATNISYTLPVESNVSLFVYDATGRMLRVLTNERKNPGTYSIPINAKDLSTGVYFITLVCLAGVRDSRNEYSSLSSYAGHSESVSGGEESIRITKKLILMK